MPSALRLISTVTATVEPGNSIKDRMREFHLDIDRAVIKNGVILKYNGNVNLAYYLFEKLPLRFVEVTGYFDVSHNRLTTLLGSPINVGGTFWCQRNKLTSLQYCPKHVGGAFHCEENPGSASFKRPTGIKGRFVTVLEPVRL